jgi:hypothetical protein
MSEIDDRKALAKKIGIANADSLGAAKLYKALKEKLGNKSIADAIADHKAGKSVDDIKRSGSSSSSSSSSSTPAKAEEAKKVDESKVEVLPPGHKYDSTVQVHAPQIHNHIASPNVSYERSEAPAWHEITGTLWSTVQTLITGAAAYALVEHWGPVFIHVASIN